jgi:hypothetical protein
MDHEAYASALVFELERMVRDTLANIRLVDHEDGPNGLY